MQGGEKKVKREKIAIREEIFLTSNILNFDYDQQNDTEKVEVKNIYTFLVNGAITGYKLCCIGY